MGCVCSTWWEKNMFDPVLEEAEDEQVKKLRKLVLSDIRADHNVLEVNLGQGLNLPHYPRVVEELHTLSLNPNLSEATRRRAFVLCFQLRHHQGDGLKFPMEDEFFDVVVAAYTLVSIQGLASFLCEVNRVLKMGGTLRVVEPPDDDFPWDLILSTGFEVSVRVEEKPKTGHWREGGVLTAAVLKKVKVVTILDLEGADATYGVDPGGIALSAAIAL
eukprot:jgi/Mesvir1/21722/Mv04134-RA.1